MSNEIESTDAVKIKGVKNLTDQVRLKVSRDPNDKNLDNTGSLYIAGMPGIGKTAIIGQLCEKADWGFVSTNGAAWDIGELRGMPDIRGDSTKFIKPEILHQIEKLAAEKEVVVVFVDEAAKINTFSEGLFYELINEKQVNPHKKLPDNVEFILASNTVDHGALSDNELNPVLLNRGGFFEYEGPTCEEYLDHAAETSVHHSVISFLKENEQFLSDYNPDRNVNATPRSWSNLGKSITKAENMGFEPSISFISELAGQYIPQDITKDFVAHLAFDNAVPKLADLTENPQTVDLPEGISASYYMVYKMAHSLTEENAKSFDIVAQRLTNSEVKGAFIKAVDNSGKSGLLQSVAIKGTTEEKSQRIENTLDDVLTMTKRR